MQPRSQKVASDGTHNLAKGPCKKSIKGKLVMNLRCNFAQNLAILMKMRAIWFQISQISMLNTP